MKLGKALKNIVGSVAPMIGTALGGPFGGLAGKAIATALGTDDPKQIEAKVLAGDKETMMALKEAETSFEVTMRELDIEESDLYLKDRQDARAMAKEVGIWPQYSIVVGLTAMLAYVIFKLMNPAANATELENNILYMLLGNLTTAWLGAIAFFVGTTKSSQDKNQRLDRAGR